MTDERRPDDTAVEAAHTTAPLINDEPEAEVDADTVDDEPETA